jgi:hypothetical protein
MVCGALTVCSLGSVGIEVSKEEGDDRSKRFLRCAPCKRENPFSAATEKKYTFKQLGICNISAL